MNPQDLGQDPAELGPDQQQVWRREEEYWALFYRGDAGALALVSEDFLGWPHTADAPQDKTALATTLAIYRAKPVLPSLRPVRLNVAGDTAIVHLLRTIAGPGLPPPSEQTPLRAIHVWGRRGGAWFLIGGMGYLPAKT
ncbi:MAG: nuclear transport factor 2 family protein [Deferrisomatales bacterium]|nr:nuclear transport factor 2 family protein [Deferrisomatales bacterium]